MRFFYFIFLFLALSGISNGQTLVNYSSARNSAVTYTSINLLGTSFASWRNVTSNTQDDNRSDLTNIGFDFWYGGVRYTQFSVSTNGFLDFSNSTDDGGPQADDFGYQNTAFTTANAANATRPAIAPFYDDLTAQGGTAALGNSLKYLLSGSAPNRTLTIEWINMAVYNNVTPSLNFQVKLVESTGQIIVHYGTMNAGTNNFSYSMGLNGPTVSNTPTSAQLKELQAVNGNSFSNAVQNGLSAMPASTSQYIFTPIVPTAVSGSLSFSGVSQTAITLNWPNWATNEVGYVIYNSTDGINYSFVTQTAANAVSSAVTGLLPSTTYYWRLYAVTEGCLSNPLTGTQATSAAGNKISVTTGNWNTATTWAPTGVPTAADNVTIANGHTVSLNVSAQCNNLIIGQGSASALQFTGNTARTFTVNNDITVNNLAAFTTLTSSNATHTVSAEGNIINNGTINFRADANSLVNIAFSKDGNQTISGTGATTSLNRINVNLGTSASNILEISTSNLSAATNFLDLISGTLKVSTANAVNVTPFTAAASLPSTTGLWLNSSNLTMNCGAGITLYGGITISNGTLNVGNAANEDLLCNGGSITISSGLFNIAGKLDGSGINNLCDFNISGGSLVVPTFGSTNTTIAPFHISGAGSQCNMTGGTIVIQNEGGTGAQNLGFTNTGTSGAIVTGGTLQIGNSSTSTAQIIDINTDSQIQNLIINSSNATARLNTSSLNVVGNVNIVSGTLNANNLDITVGGNWTNGSSFTPGTARVTFSSSSAQSIFKSGGETFYALAFTGSGTKTFSSAITANSNFSINTGATVDVSVSNQSLTVKGNFINSGTFNGRSGQVLLNGTVAQTIGGSSTTDFFDLSLNNTSGAGLANAENLIGTLTLSNGALNLNSNPLTMISTATATARIAQITGSGDIVGDVTVQRFIPGGTTGWALLGSPIFPTITLQSWDDDLYISCPTCPDGYVPGFTSIYTYDESATGTIDDPIAYVPMSSITDPLIQGKGYWVYLGNGQNTTTDITIDVTGNVRKFNYTIPLSYNNYGSVADDGWNLINNPYPSPISWASLRGSTTNLDNAIYVYNTDLNGGTGGYATYINGISSPAVGAGGINDIIPMGQGFYVHSTGATSLAASESNKISGNPTFLKSSSQVSQSMIRFYLNGLNGFNDECVLYQQQGASNNFDYNLDAFKLFGQDPNAPTIALENANEVFQVNGVAPIAGTFSMNLKTLTGYTGSYTLSASNFSSFPIGTCFNLFDKFTNTTIDLKSTDYVFNLIDTTTIARFVLSITSNSLQVTNNVTQPTCQSQTGTIISKGTNSGPWNYYWKDGNGNAIKTSLNKMDADTLSSAGSGTFYLEINTIGMCDNYASNFSIAGVTIPQVNFLTTDSAYLSVGAGFTFTNISNNATSYVWDFGDGSSNATSTSPTHNYNAPGSYEISLIGQSISGCLDTAFKTIFVVDDALGIFQKDLATGVFILKNLGDNLFLIENTNSIDELLQIDLNDANGKSILYRSLINEKDLSVYLNMNVYDKGVYFLILTSQSYKKVIKLIVS